MSYFAPYIDETGFHAPTYEERLEALATSYRNIFGLDADLDPSSPDYQLLSIFAKALDDTSALMLQAYNSRNPLYASGQALDLLLPMYGIARESGEDDASVRARIANGMISHGAATLDVIESAVKACRWVRDAKVYENDTDTTDANGIPAHSLATVIFAGDGPAVARAIWQYKAPGVGTYGNTYEDITDDYGNTVRINFSRTTVRRVYAYMSIRRLPGCVDADVAAAVTAAVNTYINDTLGVAEPLIIPRLYAIAYNADPVLAQTFAVSDIYANLQGESTYTRDEITCPWNSKISIIASGGLTITFTGP